MKSDGSQEMKAFLASLHGSIARRSTLAYDDGASQIRR